MKLRHITLLVSLLITTVFGYQCYWLVHLYQAQKAEYAQRVAEAMERGDYEEMTRRAKSIGHRINAFLQLDLNDKQSGRELLSTFVKRIQRKDIEILTTTQKFRITSPEAAQKEAIGKDITPDSVLGDTPYHQFSSNIRNNLHDVLDTIKACNLPAMRRLVAIHLFAGGKRQPMRLQLTDTLGTVLATDSDSNYRQHWLDNHYDYAFGDSIRRVYRLTMPATTRKILPDMAGILAGSLLILLLLVFVFWYLIRTVGMLRTLDEMKSDFTNNMTHELKTPLSVAYAANDALLNYGATHDEARMRKYLLISQQQLQRLSGLVEQILSMSMERRKTMKINLEEMEVAPTVEALIAQQQLKAGKPVDIRAEVDNGLTLTTDRVHFCNILNNLLDNAVKYSDGRPHITLTARRSGSQTVITVADRGIGIAREQQQYIFDKFYRVPHGNLHAVKGYGLGLYYVRQMTERLGGTVAVESAPGKGTTFRLIFNG